MGSCRISRQLSADSLLWTAFFSAKKHQETTIKQQFPNTKLKADS
jgi:hypothetical protein